MPFDRSGSDSIAKEIETKNKTRKIAIITFFISSPLTGNEVSRSVSNRLYAFDRFH